MPPDRSQPMPVKHWARAGLMLTWWCNAACDCCYLSCGPGRREWMDVELALRAWRELLAASPHGCRVHLTGGEPFGDFPRLLAVARAAADAGLGPLEKVETNAFWATDAELIRNRLRDLDAAGMGKLVISADPCHQQYVPIARPRLAAEVAASVLGPHRVQVRWRDWLAEGFDTGSLDKPQRQECFARWAARGRDRLGGRAADRVAPLLECKSPEEFTDISCESALLRSGHVHVGCQGEVFPGTCAGILIGDLRHGAAEDIWRQLDRHWRQRPIVAALAVGGPAALLPAARDQGFTPRDGYASKCHLCWDIRRCLSRTGRWPRELGPAWMYEQQDLSRGPTKGPLRA